MDDFNDIDFTGLNFESEFDNIFNHAGSKPNPPLIQGHDPPSSSGGPSASFHQVQNDVGPHTSTFDSSISCSSCERYRMECERLDREHRVNFQFLKKKIINTDLLIRRFKTKQDESEMLSKTVDNLKQKLEQATRDSNILSEQLQSTVEGMKPLKEKNVGLESELRQKVTEISDLHTMLAAEKAFSNQKVALDEETKSLQGTVASLKKQLAAVENKKQKLDVKATELEVLRDGLTGENRTFRRRVHIFAKALQQAQAVVSDQWKILSANGLKAGKGPCVIPASCRALLGDLQRKVEEANDSDEQSFSDIGSDELESFQATLSFNDDSLLLSEPEDGDLHEGPNSTKAKSKKNFAEKKKGTKSSTKETPGNLSHDQRADVFASDILSQKGLDTSDSDFELSDEDENPKSTPEQPSLGNVCDVEGKGNLQGQKTVNKKPESNLFGSSNLPSLGFELSVDEKDKPTNQSKNKGISKKSFEDKGQSSEKETVEKDETETQSFTTETFSDSDLEDADNAVDINKPVSKTAEVAHTKDSDKNRTQGRMPSNLSDLEMSDDDEDVKKSNGILNNSKGRAKLPENKRQQQNQSSTGRKAKTPFQDKSASAKRNVRADSLSSLSEDSDDESVDLDVRHVKTKGQFTRKFNNVPGNQRGRLIPNNKRTLHPDVGGSLRNTAVNNFLPERDQAFSHLSESNDEEEDNDTPEVPFKFLSGDTESEGSLLKATSQSVIYKKTELMSLLTFANIENALSPLPPSPCPSAVSDVHTDDTESLQPFPLTDSSDSESEFQKGNLSNEVMRESSRSEKGKASSEKTGVGDGKEIARIGTMEEGENSSAHTRESSSSPKDVAIEDSVNSCVHAQVSPSSRKDVAMEEGVSSLVRTGESSSCGQEELTLFAKAESCLQINGEKSFPEKEEDLFRDKAENSSYDKVKSSSCDISYSQRCLSSSDTISEGVSLNLTGSFSVISTSDSSLEQDSVGEFICADDSKTQGKEVFEKNKSSKESGINTTTTLPPQKNILEISVTDTDSASAKPQHPAQFTGETKCKVTTADDVSSVSGIEKQEQVNRNSNADGIRISSQSTVPKAMSESVYWAKKEDKLALNSSASRFESTESYFQSNSRVVTADDKSLHLAEGAEGHLEKIALGQIVSHQWDNNAGISPPVVFTATSPPKPKKKSEPGNSVMPDAVLSQVCLNSSSLTSRNGTETHVMQPKKEPKSHTCLAMEAIKRPHSPQCEKEQDSRKTISNMRATLSSPPGHASSDKLANSMPTNGDILDSLSVRNKTKKFSLLDITNNGDKSESAKLYGKSSACKHRLSFDGSLSIEEIAAKLQSLSSGGARDAISASNLSVSNVRNKQISNGNIEAVSRKEKVNNSIRNPTSDARKNSNSAVSNTRDKKDNMNGETSLVERNAGCQNLETPSTTRAEKAVGIDDQRRSWISEDGSERQRVVKSNEAEGNTKHVMLSSPVAASLKPNESEYAKAATESIPRESGQGDARKMPNGISNVADLDPISIKAPANDKGESCLDRCDEKKNHSILATSDDEFMSKDSDGNGQEDLMDWIISDLPVKSNVPNDDLEPSTTSERLTPSDQVAKEDICGNSLRVEGQEKAVDNPAVGWITSSEEDTALNCREIKQDHNVIEEVEEEKPRLEMNIAKPDEISEWPNSPNDAPLLIDEGEDKESLPLNANKCPSGDSDEKVLSIDIGLTVVNEDKSRNEAANERAISNDTPHSTLIMDKVVDSSSMQPDFRTYSPSDISAQGGVEEESPASPPMLSEEIEANKALVLSAPLVIIPLESQDQLAVHQATQPEDVKSPGDGVQSGEELSEGEIPDSPQKMKELADEDELSDLYSHIDDQTFYELLKEMEEFYRVPPLLSPLLAPVAGAKSRNVKPLGSLQTQARTRGSLPLGVSAVERDGPAVASGRKKVLDAKMPVRDGRKEESAHDGTSNIKARLRRKSSEKEDSASAKKVKLIPFTGFGSVLEAVKCDLRHYLAGQTPNVEQTRHQMCERGDNKTATSVWSDVIKAVIATLKSVAEDVLGQLLTASEADRPPTKTFNSDHEKSLLALLTSFIKHGQGIQKGGLMEALWNAIFDRAPTPLHGRLALCRTFTSLCQGEGKIDILYEQDQVKNLLFHVACCGYLDFPQLFISAVGVWPFFTHLKPQPVASSGICLAIEFILRQLEEKDEQLYQQIGAILETSCKWKLQKAKPKADELLKALTAMIEGEGKDFSPKAFEAMKGLEMLLAHKGPAWTHEHFLLRSVVSVVTSWRFGKEDNVPQHRIVAVLRISRDFLASNKPIAEKAAKLLVNQVFSKVIEKKSKVPEIELAVGECLLEVATFLPQRCLALLAAWQEANRELIPNQLLARLMQMRANLANMPNNGKNGNRPGKKGKGKAGGGGGKKKKKAKQKKGG